MTFLTSFISLSKSSGYHLVHVFPDLLKLKEASKEFVFVCLQAILLLVKKNDALLNINSNEGLVINSVISFSQNYFCLINPRFAAFLKIWTLTILRSLPLVLRTNFQTSSKSWALFVLSIQVWKFAKHSFIQNIFNLSDCEKD